MNYENLNTGHRDGIDGLKYNSVTIEAEVNQALDESATEEEFCNDVESRMDNIIAECQGVIASFQHSIPDNKCRN